MSTTQPNEIVPDMEKEGPDKNVDNTIVDEKEQPDKNGDNIIVQQVSSTPPNEKVKLDKNTDNVIIQQSSAEDEKEQPDENAVNTIVQNTLCTSEDEKKQLEQGNTIVQQASSTANGEKEQVDKNTDNTIIQPPSSTSEDLTKLMEQLKTSAAAWAHQFRFEKELQDLSSMITHDPKDPTHYLSVGRRYAELGQQKEAIQIFNTGLEKVPETHTDYKQLQQEKEKAQLRQDHLIDIFGRFSYDIAYLFVDTYFSQQEAAEYTRVSSTWRKIILSHPKIWRRIDGHAEWNKPKKTISPFLLLPSISHHIQELQLPKHQPTNSYFECIRDCDFKQLEWLKINTLYCNKKNYFRLIPALQNISGTLTSLDITLGLNDNNMPAFSYVLRACPHLISLRFICSPKRQQVILPIFIHHTTKLKTLTLWSRHEMDKIKKKDLQRIMVSSPDLRYLAIGNCDESVYTAFQEHNSDKLETFIVQHVKGFFLNDTLSKSKLDHEEKETTHLGGLTHFTAKEFTSPFSLVPVLKKHHNTIHSLSLYIANTPSNLSPPDWQKVLCLYPVYNLTSLQIGHIGVYDIFRRRAVESSAFYVLLTVAPKLSNLESLELYNVKVPDNVLDAIGRLPKLTKLKLSKIHCYSENLLALIKRFEVKSNYTAKRREEESLSSLTQLDLDTLAIKPDIAEAACKIQTLTHLYISDLGNRYGVFDTFVQEVTKLPLLEDLEIGNAQRLTLDDFEVLSTMTSLCRLGLFKVNKSTHDNIQKVTFPPSVNVIISKHEKMEDDEKERVGMLIVS
ncbi:hypothetical protein INT45_008405 [Circinella minor]|uniref:F-box domain-containing protein n=1 Tax=Circinella minor TaxID=1195481 RepID=A0A8H7RR53_9FUNG|nr:hypothetical protein INT45_008405 [Circinella minor]